MRIGHYETCGRCHTSGWCEHREAEIEQLFVLLRQPTSPEALPGMERARSLASALGQELSVRTHREEEVPRSGAVQAANEALAKYGLEIVVKS